MSQTFKLRLATETIALDAKEIGTTIEKLQHIHIMVSAKISQLPEPCLWLTYKIELNDTYLATKLDWPTWQPTQVFFSDYLWEHTCLECFIAIKTLDTKNADSIDVSLVNNSCITDFETMGYIEINASPNGHYAIYQFESYRNPSTLPPSPLLTTDNTKHAQIKWADSLVKEKISSEKTFYERSFGMALEQLPKQTSNNNNNTSVIERIHPCVILWFGDTALYFAPSHATPPDFHQQKHWSCFDT